MVCVPGQAGQYLFGSAKRWFGIDDPFGFGERCEPFGEGADIGQCGEITEEAQLSCPVQSQQAFQE